MSRKRVDIYNFEAKLRSAYSLLETAKISEEDKQLIRDFIEHLKAIGVGTGRQSKYIFHLKVIGENLGTNFRAVNRKDIERFMSWLRSRKLESRAIGESSEDDLPRPESQSKENKPARNYSPETIADYILVIKRFYKYVRYGNVDKDTPFPEEVRWLHKTIKLSDLKEPEILSPKEITKMIMAAKTLRDKAMIAVGFDMGSRAGELLTLNRGDVWFDEQGAHLQVGGKTGERTLLLVPSASILARYIEDCLNGRSPDSPLWITMSTNRHGERLGWRSWNRILKQVAKDAGIEKKRIYNHLLRHSSVTEKLTFFTDSEAKVYYGWSKSSKMLERYNHLRPENLNKKITSVYKGQQAQPPKPEFQPLICLRCGKSNSPGMRFCSQCGTPLSQEEVAKASIERTMMAGRLQDLEEKLSKILSESSQKKGASS